LFLLILAHRGQLHCSAGVDLGCGMIATVFLAHRGQPHWDSRRSGLDTAGLIHQMKARKWDAAEAGRLTNEDHCTYRGIRQVMADLSDLAESSMS
jgi:hypothetical protein